ncbi:MAG TPA: hypothetical protein VI336_02960, partial [Candidatus Saccharimonadales bacterium]|nr:hypothetical protein [Candidatus Saccharimonadales bacterium]
IITGSKGYLQANYITQEITLYEKMDIVQKDSFEGFVEAFGEPEEHIIRLAKKEPLRRQLSAFVLAAATGNRQELISPREALSALDIAIAAATRLKERKNGRS